MEKYNLRSEKDFNPLDSVVLGRSSRCQPWAVEILAEERGSMECVGGKMKLINLQPITETSYQAVSHIFFLGVCMCANFSFLSIVSIFLKRVNFAI